MYKFFKSLFCRHKIRFLRNVYGDEINRLDGKRSIWECKKCGSIVYQDDLILTPQSLTER